VLGGWNRRSRRVCTDPVNDHNQLLVCWGHTARAFIPFMAVVCLASLACWTLACVFGSGVWSSEVCAYVPVQHWLVGFYNRDGVCLLRGTFYILRSAHTVYLCFVWIWEQTAIISLYSIDWLVSITDGVCLLRGTFYILHSAHSVFMCFVWIWEYKAFYFSIQW
jgi:hypothetical protein